MKLTTVTIVLIAVLGFAFIPVGESLEIGSAAPNATLEMKATSGDMLSLDELKGEKGLLVVFTCNTCPFVVGSKDRGTTGWETRYNDLYDMANANDVGMVLVNSNEAKREGDDSFEAMQKKAKSSKYKAPYVVDKNSVLANTFHAKTTPHIFLFDGDLSLVYKGAIDDNHEDASKVEATWLKDALGKLSVGDPASIDPNSTNARGCSIKRVK